MAGKKHVPKEPRGNTIKMNALEAIQQLTKALEAGNYNVAPSNMMSGYVFTTDISGEYVWDVDDKTIKGLINHLNSLKVEGQTVVYLHTKVYELFEQYMFGLNTDELLLEMLCNTIKGLEVKETKDLKKHTIPRGFHRIVS